MACRDLNKAAVAREELLKESAKVEIRKLDLSSLQSVRDFASGIVKDNIKVHILINNAGVLIDESVHVDDKGYQESFYNENVTF